MTTIGVCTDCNLTFEDDGTKNNCVCPKCSGSNYSFYNLATVVRFNYRGKIYIKELDYLAKQVDLFAIIEISKWFNSAIKSRKYECFAVDGTRLDIKKPIPEELYNAQINISYGAGYGG